MRCRRSCASGCGRARGAGTCPSADGFPGGALALPVARRRAAGAGDAPLPEAWLIAAKDAGPLNELDRLTLHQAVTIVALELLRRRVVDDTERRLAGDVLSALVAGDLAGAELARRLEPFGLRERRACWCSRRRAACGPRPRRRSRGPCARRPAAGWSRGRGAPLCALLPARPTTTSCSRSPQRVHARVERDDRPDAAGRRGAHASRRPTCAAGSTRRAARWRRARWRSTGTATASGLATYRDLGSFQLLLSLQDDDALRLFCDSILAPIEDSEGAYGGELMRSLEAFIECNGQWERAAQGALLSPSHAALPDPPRRGADRQVAGLRPRPDRLLARAPWT